MMLKELVELFPDANYFHLCRFSDNYKVSVPRKEIDASKAIGFINYMVCMWWDVIYFDIDENGDIFVIGEYVFNPFKKVEAA